MSFASLCRAGFDFAAKASLLGERFTLRGKTITGVIESSDTAEALLSGGFSPSTPLVVRFKERTFTPALTIGEQLIYEGGTYTIRHIDSDAASMKLTCEHKAKR